ncbi:hypothetical protein AKO1_011870 [Acrasis kona]|uniref:Uncharacterized protein n=1 Tax=Acrasis kona TaxID=1008807 RepID=A0AAW2Z3N3_9EUKA
MQPEKTIRMIDDIIAYNDREMSRIRRKRDKYLNKKYDKETRDLEALFQSGYQSPLYTPSTPSNRKSIEIILSPVVTIKKTLVRIRSFTSSPKMCR